MGYAEFDSWRRKGNELAVESLKNSETMSWSQFQSNLAQALQYYDRTPGLGLLYDDLPSDTVEQQDQAEVIKLQILKIFTQSRIGRDGPTYIEEILRIQKNRTVIFRALIQNLYV